jgi:GNAT superfamily N-acetyltransferase
MQTRACSPGPTAAETLRQQPFHIEDKIAMNQVPEPIRIRDARHEDAATIADFNSAMALQTENKTLDTATVRAGVAAVLADPRHGFYLIAETDGNAIGCLMITREWSDWRNGDWWWLQSVYIRSEYRRTGVFRKLYEELERRAATISSVIGLRLYVETDNAHAQRTYAALGMSEARYRMYEKTIGRARSVIAGKGE